MHTGKLEKWAETQSNCNSSKWNRLRPGWFALNKDWAKLTELAIIC